MCLSIGIVDDVDKFHLEFNIYHYSFYLFAPLRNFTTVSRIR